MRVIAMLSGPCAADALTARGVSARAAGIGDWIAATD